MQPFQFEAVITLGNVLTVAALLVSAGGFVYVLREKVMDLSNRLSHVEGKLNTFLEAMVVLARQDERLKAIDKRLEHIETKIFRD